MTIQTNHQRRDYENRDYYVFHFSKNTDPVTFSDKLGFKYERPINHIRDHHLLSISKDISEEDIIDRISVYFSNAEDHETETLNDKIHYYEKQHLRRREKRVPPLINNKLLNIRSTDSEINPQMLDIMTTLDIKDPLFHKQWHLINTIIKGNDINVTGVWKEGITGKGAIVAVVDDGLDMNSADLKDNYYAKGSFDFINHNPNPIPKAFDDRHGTRCAGEIAAVKNDACGVGVAYNSKVSGILILGSFVTDIDEAESLNHDFHNNMIYSCSWGPNDNGKVVDGPPALVYKALVNGINNGRNGLGSIYVFASGNGGLSYDNCNFDGYANSIFTITIGAIDMHNNPFVYSELCACQLAVTYSGGYAGYIYTTDVGENECTSKHGGTSASAPLASGILALVLSVRPELTWRDLQDLIVQTAVKFGDDLGWEKTYSGRFFHYYYGFGKLDAYKMVDVAKKKKLLKPQARFSSKVKEVNQRFSNNNGMIKSVIIISKDQTNSVNFESLEHVSVNVNIRHQKRGDLKVSLISPNGITSVLATRRYYDDGTLLLNWEFMTVKHWRESFVGPWTLEVEDKKDPERDGFFFNWRINLWGESIDPKKAVPIPDHTSLMVVHENYTSFLYIDLTPSTTSISDTTVTSIDESTSTTSFAPTSTSIPITTSTTSAISYPTSTASTASTTSTTSTSITKISEPTSTEDNSKQKHIDESIHRNKSLSLFQKNLWLFIILIILFISFIIGLCYICFIKVFRKKHISKDERSELELLNTISASDIYNESEDASIFQNYHEMFTAFDIDDTDNYSVN